MSELTHLDEQGRARMVDVTQKAVSVRAASARATVLLGEESARAVAATQAPKGT